MIKAYRQIEESVLWEKVCVSDDQLAFEVLYKRLSPSVFAYGMTLLDSRLKVEDEVQELFAYLWRKRKDLVIRNQLKTYLFTALRNNLVKKNKRLITQELPSDFELIDEKNETLDFQEDQLKRLDKELIKLPKRQQEIILLRYKENRSYEEIIEIMNINKASAYKLLLKAIKRLKQLVTA